MAAKDQLAAVGQVAVLYLQILTRAKISGSRDAEKSLQREPASHWPSRTEMVQAHVSLGRECFLFGLFVLPVFFLLGLWVGVNKVLLWLCFIHG